MHGLESGKRYYFLDKKTAYLINPSQVMYIKKILAYLLILPALFLSSCINDDLDECDINIRFNYSWNMLNSNSFAEQVDEVHLLVFDKAGTYIKTVHDKGPQVQREGYSLTVNNLLTDEDYHFLAISANNENKDALSHLELTKMISGETKIQDLTAKLKGLDTGKVFKTALNNYLIGQVSTEDHNQQVNFTINKKKINEKIRVALIDESNRELTTDDFSISLEDINGFEGIKYDFTPLSKGSGLTYHPYFYQKVENRENTGFAHEPEKINATAAEFSVLRLSEKQNLRLIVTDKAGKKVIDKNIIDLIYLLKLEGHLSSEMSFQEYLDREDNFAISLYVSGDTSTWLGTKIIINGWIINLIDIDF